MNRRTISVVLDFDAGVAVAQAERIGRLHFGAVDPDIDPVRLAKLLDLHKVAAGREDAQETRPHGRILRNDKSRKRVSGEAAPTC